MEDMLAKSDKRQEIAEELADITYHVLRIAQKFDIDLSWSFMQKC